MKVSLQNQYLADSLQRFEQARKLAQQRMKGAGPRQNLLEIIKKKQEKAKAGREISLGNREEKEVNAPQHLGLSHLLNQTLHKANELLLYTSDSNNEPKEPGKKNLGNYVDVMA